MRSREIVIREISRVRLTKINEVRWLGDDPTK